MFEVGDKIVCINNGVLFASNNTYEFDKSYCLTMYKTYTVVLKKSDTTISLINDQNLQQPFANERFIPLIEYRRIKLEKICTKLGM